MSQTLTQKHLDLLNLIATSPPPIDASQMVTKLRRPSLEDILASATTTAKASNRVSMSGIYVRSRPTSFSEFDVTLDPNYDYEDFLARPISQTAVKETMASLGLRLQQGRAMFMQLSQLHGQLQQDESTPTSFDAVLAPTGVMPPMPTRPLPTLEGPPPGCVTIVSSIDGYESDGEEIVYMLDEYSTRHQCMLVDTKGQAPGLPLPATPESDTHTQEKLPCEEEAQDLAAPSSTKPTDASTPDAGIDNRPESADVPAESTSNAFEEPRKPELATSRANKRMGVLGIQVAPTGIDTPIVNAPIMQAETNSAPVTRARTLSKSVTFAPDTRIIGEPKVSYSKAASPEGSKEKAPVDASASKISTAEEAHNVKLSATDGKDQIPTPAVEVFEVDFAELEKANAMSIVDGATERKVKKKHHFGVYKVIRSVLKRKSAETKVEKPTPPIVETPTIIETPTVVEEPARSKTPTPSIATTVTVGGRRTVLCKPNPATKATTSAASAYSVSVAPDTASQKSKKPFRAWSIRSGKGGRKGATDPVPFPAITGGTGLLAPTTTGPTGHGVRRRSASFSGFATIATPSWDDPVDMDQLLKDAAERLRQQPKREWIYKPKADPILEEGENPVDVGFVLERHVAI